MADAVRPPPEEGVNVNVILRCRPHSAQEIAERAPQVIHCNEALREVTLFQNAGGKQLSRTFRYDKVFGPDSKQEKVYSQAIVPIVEEVLDGFNCTIFAYGQTGTGKTYTMEGGPRNSVDGNNLSAEAGVIPRAIKQVFDAIDRNQVSDSSVKVSFLELYNEELTDLLASGGVEDKRLRLLEDRSGVVVQGLEEVIVKSATEIYQVLDRGTSKRRTAETLLNKRSSRSHSVFAITIHLKETTPEGEDVIKIGKLNLVDLAGSENISRSGARDGRAREAGNINQSLLTLGRVITALVEHSGHVPYRDSKLTRLLRDSLGGKTKTCIIATIAPSVHCSEETISTLDYAHRAKNIRNRPEVNQRITKTAMIKELANEIERLKLDLVATREKNGVFLSNERYEQGELERVQLREMVTRMRAELEAVAVMHQEELDALTSAHAGALESERRQVNALNLALAQEKERAEAAETKVLERQFVVLAQRRAEAALEGHAEALSAELGGAARQLGDAFSRLQAAVELTAADRGALRAVCDDIGAAVDCMAAAVAAAAGAQRTALSSVCGRVEEFQARKHEEMQQLGERIGEVQGVVQRAEAALLAALEGQAAAADGALSGVLSSQRALAVGAAEAMAAAGAAAGTALTGLSDALAAQSRQLVAFAEAQAGAAADAAAHVAAMAERARGGLGQMAEAAAEMHGGSDAAAGAAAQALAELPGEVERELAGRQQEVMAQIGALLQGLVRAGGAAAAARATGLAAQLQDARQTAGERAQALRAAAGSCSEALLADAAAYAQSSRDLQAALLQPRDAFAPALGAAGRQAADVAAQVLQHGNAMAEQQTQQVQSLERTAADTRAALLASRQNASTTVQQRGSELGGALTALQHQLAERSEGDAALAAGIGELAADKAAEMQEFGDAQAATLARIRMSVEERTRAALAAAPPALPPTPLVALPPPRATAQLLCPPELLLVEQFERQRQEVLARGGDPADVFEVLGAPGGEGKWEAGENSPPSEAWAALGEGGASKVAAAIAAGGVSTRSRIPMLGDKTNLG